MKVPLKRSGMGAWSDILYKRPEVKGGVGRRVGYQCRFTNHMNLGATVENCEHRPIGENVFAVSVGVGDATAEFRVGGINRMGGGHTGRWGQRGGSSDIINFKTLDN